MSISQTANGVSVSWTGTGVLQSSDTLGAGAAWAPVTGATNPYNAPTTGKMKFFRVAQ